MSRELQPRRNQPHEGNEQGIEEPKEGTNQLNEINKQIIEQLKKNNHWAAESVSLISNDYYFTGLNSLSLTAFMKG